MHLSMLASLISAFDFFDYAHWVVCLVVFDMLMCLSRPLHRLRDGDVTIWYQSPWLQQWASMGQEGAVTEGRITFSVQQNSREQRIQKNGLSISSQTTGGSGIPPLRVRWRSFYSSLRKVS